MNDTDELVKNYFSTDLKIDVSQFDIKLVLEWAEKTNNLRKVLNDYSKNMEDWEHGADNDVRCKELREKLETLEQDVSRQSATVAGCFARLIGYTFNTETDCWEYEQELPDFLKK